MTPSECEPVRLWSLLDSGQHPFLQHAVRHQRASTTVGLFRRQLRDSCDQKCSCGTVSQASEAQASHFSSLDLLVRSGQEGHDFSRDNFGDPPNLVCAPKVVHTLRSACVEHESSDGNRLCEYIGTLFLDLRALHEVRVVVAVGTARLRSSILGRCFAWCRVTWRRLSCQLWTSWKTQ